MYVVCILLTPDQSANRTDIRNQSKQSKANQTHLQSVCDYKSAGCIVKECENENSQMNEMKCRREKETRKYDYLHSCSFAFDSAELTLSQCVHGISVNNNIMHWATLLHSFMPI